MKVERVHGGSLFPDRVRVELTPDEARCLAEALGPEVQRVAYQMLRSVADECEQ